MPRRLTLVIHSLNGGGAERVLAAMANRWAQEGNEVTFVTLASAENDIYELPASVNRVCLRGMQESSNVLQAIINNVKRLTRLRRAIHDAHADAVISFTDKMNILTLLACIGLRQRVVICERVDPRMHEIGRSWSFLRRMTYAWCDTLVVQTESVRYYFLGFVPDSKIRVIRNEVQEPANTPANRLAREPWIVALGRLEKQKGFDLLIDAFAQIAGQHPGWRLKILGEGSQRQSLTDQILGLGLEQSVELCGWVDRPQSWLQKSALFVLSSRYEGFPNALLEAMAAGVPAISFNCDSGPSEIIRHEIDGLLVPADDVKRLAQAIDRLISNPEERAAFGERALDVTKRFSQVQFYRQWETILNAKPGNPAAARET